MEKKKSKIDLLLEEIKKANKAIEDLKRENKRLRNSASDAEFYARQAEYNTRRGDDSWGF